MKIPGALGDLGHPVLGLADHDERAESHAALAGSAESGTGDGIESVVLVAVGQHGGVVLGTQVGLHTFAVGGPARVDVLAGTVGPDERDALDRWLVEDEVDGPGGAVHDVDHSIGEAGLFTQLRDDHGRAGIPLAGL